MTKDKTKWSYLAALFDGEGCISISSYPRIVTDYRSGKSVMWNRSLLQVCVANTSKRLIDWLIQNFGGFYFTKVFEHNNWKTSYRWQIKGKENKKNVFLGILPYLVIKREQALLALKYLQLEGKGTKEQYTELAMKCSILNRKGKSVETNTSSTSNEVKIESDLLGDEKNESVVMQVA